VNTPRGLNLTDPNTSRLLLGAFAEAVRAAPNDGWSPQSKWGDLQLVVRGDLRIPIHGGPDAQGVYNMAQGEPRSDHTHSVSLGSSYIQAVAFENDGPRVDTFLTYSQSTDPRSPHFADQTQRFSRKEWIRLPFTQAQIEADPSYSVRVLAE
jgi:acyl-homoserine-lactone acylase